MIINAKKASENEKKYFKGFFHDKVKILNQEEKLKILFTSIVYQNENIENDRVWWENPKNAQTKSWCLKKVSNRKDHLIWYFEKEKDQKGL